MLKLLYTLHNALDIKGFKPQVNLLNLLIVENSTSKHNDGFVIFN